MELLAVAAHARRRGLGEALLDRAIDDMRLDVRGLVELGTDDDGFHEPARHLYERL